MPAVIVVGAQWGDEGKGRVVDWLARDAKVVARFNGGDNAGHTVVAQGRTLKLHLVPSGILYPTAVCVLGAGVVVNPERLIRELDELASLEVNIDPSRLKIGAAAHIILASHRALDGANETSRGGAAIGTTKRGIGPAYADKAARTNLRAHEMLNPKRFAQRVAERVETHNKLLRDRYGVDAVPLDGIADAYRSYAERLAPYVADASLIVSEALGVGDMVLCEGAQGLLLDIDHGTYPYVTSSATISGGALTGLGFGPSYVSRIMGIVKAYTTRVGAGPFPTELLDGIGERIRTVGVEFGTTTGRPRRCGWLDAVILRYAVRINGLNEIALTKLDVLSGLETLKVAVAYERDGVRTDHFPAEFGIEQLAEWQPIYEELPGWSEDITDCRSRAELPATARDYVSRIEDWTGVPVTFIGVGPAREQMIL